MRAIAKIHGGLGRLHRFITQLFPTNAYDIPYYFEPCVGMGSVLFNKKRHEYEVINDIDSNICDLFTVVRDFPLDFQKAVQDIEYTEENFFYWQHFVPTCDSQLDRAVREFVLRRFSRGGLGKHFAYSERQRGNMPGDRNSWITACKLIPKWSERLKNVQIYNKDALELIDQYKVLDILWLIDPPFLHSTRVSKDAYKNEPDLTWHNNLATILQSVKGKVMLCGYPSKEYNDWYGSWNRHDKLVVNNSSQQSKKPIKTYCVWTNY